MGFKCGIVGLPNVGKSTLFNALTQSNKAEAANYPFATIEPNIGRVAVPDDRLDKLAIIGKSEKLVKGASQGEGLGNKFLGHVREVDAIAHVVRCFEDTNITHVSSKIDPLDDIETINLELQLADLESLNNKKTSLEKKLKANDKEAKTMYICNVDEESIHTGNELSKKVIEFAKKNNHSVVLISASIEAQIAELDNEEEKLEFLKELNLDQTTLNKVIKSGYELLGLINYFTCGPKETRSWTIKKETLAPQAAGKIHTDFEKGFIRAETVSYEDYIENNGDAGSRDSGKLRQEGKDYIVKDGDVMNFLFNV